VTAARRRDKGIKGGSVLTGLRLERDVAQALCDQATTNAQGNVAELARFHIRRGLGATAAQANHLEETENVISSGLAGLSLDAATIALLVIGAARREMSKAGLARHFIRRGLGMSEAESVKREAGFTALADVYQGRSDTFHGAGK
jgi:hypothetical protein